MRCSAFVRELSTFVLIAGLGSGGAPGARAQQSPTDRIVPSWLVIGPFPVVGGPDRVSHAYLPDEASLAPVLGQRTDEGMAWQVARSDDLGRVDLQRVLPQGGLEQAAAYAFSWVTSPDERTVTLAFESDDDIQVWLDGTLVLDHEVARGVGSGTDTVTVRLARGANRLLLKVVNRTGGFGLGARILDVPGAALAELDLGYQRPAGARPAAAPRPALTVAPLGVAASAVLDAATGTLRIPVAARVTRWGGLSGSAVLRVGSHEVELPVTPDGVVAKVTLPTTWHDLTAAVAAGDRGVEADGADAVSGERAVDAGPVLDVLAHPIEVDGWRWQDPDGNWHELVDTSDFGVAAPVVRKAKAITFTAKVPAVLAGLGLEMDAAEFGASDSKVEVNGRLAEIPASGRVPLCGPCAEGDSLTVRIEPNGRWWDPPRLIVPDPGWMEISQGARWARVFLGDSAAPAPPGRDFARQLLTASAAADKVQYHALVADWMGALAPAIRRMRSDTIDIVGNAHIDAAWLWRWDETVDVVRNTWRTAAKLLRKYPGTTFAGSAAAYYQWVKEYEPSLFTELQRLQKEGRWAAVGGWWVESDANLPSGEAFVRQGLYGQRAYERFFGTTAKVAWIPDTFGYAFTLPQIFKKEGLDFFVTQKLRWNDTDPWTADKNLFWWEGRDGTRILTYIPYGYSDILDPQQLADRYKASKDSTASGRMMVLYGEGDHGGGPTMKMLDRAETLARIPTFPTLHGDVPVNVLKKMDAQAASAPVIHDELYLEYHRGVYTSQSEMKEWNRRMEGLLGATEVAASHASFFAPDDAWYNYPRGALTRAWEKTLFNQFHDLLPGSGIGPIYKDAVADYREAERVTDMELGRAAEMIAGRMDTRPPIAGALPYLVLNPSGQVRGGDAAIPWTRGPVRVVDSAGRPLPAVARGDTLRLRVPAVPQTGGLVVFLVPGQTATGVPAGTTASVEGDDIVLQNRRLRVELDRRTGEITKLVDRSSGRDVLQAGGGGNRLATRYDKPAQWDAWNIDDTGDPWIAVGDTVQVGEPGRNLLGAYVDIVRADSTGRYEQHLMLPDGEARLEVDTRALWRADHRLLKASFPLAVSFDSTWAEVPYGAIQRVAVPRTREDSARYEVSMQRWVDASDSTWGVGFVTDSKHGYDVRGDTLRLTLLKAPKYPDSTADMGWHHFRYDVVVHEGDWRTGPVERVADALNEPLHALPVEAHPGEGRARAFLKVTGEGVELGALKVAEDDNDLVVRLVERHGRPVTAGLELPWPFEWRPADLLERPDTAVGWTASVGDRATVPLKPWEIGTVLVRRR